MTYEHSIMIHHANFNLPKISIVTPSFNQGEFLEECIDSVLSQNYPNLEYIIMDGGSTDISIVIIKKYEKYLTYWQSQPDGGHYTALNQGFNKTTGEIMAWLNSDDKYHPNSFFKVAEVFNKYKSVEWLTGKATQWNREGTLEYIDEVIRDWSRSYFLYEIYEKRHFLQQESTFWRRSLWQKAGSKLRDDLKLAGDFELWLRFSRYSKCCIVYDILGGIRSYNEQRSKSMFDKYLNEVATVINQELELNMNPVENNVNSSGSHEVHPMVLDSNVFPILAKFKEDQEIVIVTSITPGNIEKQQFAIESWRSLGFTVVSLNCIEETEKLEHLYKNVHFHVVNRHAKEEVGKPLVYLDDILNYLKKHQSRICGIVNSDIIFKTDESNSGFISYILSQVKGSLIYGSRVDVHSTENLDGNVYIHGFDYFFFEKYLLEDFPSSSFCLGLPWWDYWFPYIAFQKGFSLKYLSPTIAYHTIHPANYSDLLWKQRGVHFTEFIDLKLSNLLENMRSNEPEKLRANLLTLGNQFIRFLEKNSDIQSYKNYVPSLRKWLRYQGELIYTEKEYEQLKREAEKHCENKHQAWKRAAKQLALENSKLT